MCEVTPITPPKFALGKCVATPGAYEVLDANNMLPMCVLHWHLDGRPGLLDAGDLEANRLAIANGDRILSHYELGNGEAIYIITEADRSSTCILKPSEY